MGREPVSECRRIGSLRKDEGATRTLFASAAALLLAAGLSLGCEAPEEAPRLTPEREAALADTLLSVTEEIDAAWKGLEPGSYLAHYGDDAWFYYDGAALDRATLEGLVREEMDRVERWSSEVVDPQVEVLGTDAGVVSFRYEGEWEDTAGEVRGIEAAFTAVFERRDGEWKVVQAHESLPPDAEF